MQPVLMNYRQGRIFRECGGALVFRFPHVPEPASRASRHPHELLIVRPDSYVGFAAGQAGWAEAERYLERSAAGGP